MTHNADGRVIEVDKTGKVLWEENSQDERSIASITKVMTAVVFLESATDLDQEVQIVSADPAGLLERLRDRPGVREATIFGQTVHALVDADRAPADLALDGLEVHAAEPTLEDVFVTLSRARDRNG